jgi:hypothetical protein
LCKQILTPIPNNNQPHNTATKNNFQVKKNNKVIALPIYAIACAIFTLLSFVKIFVSKSRYNIGMAVNTTSIFQAGDVIANRPAAINAYNPKNLRCIDVLIIGFDTF